MSNAAEVFRTNVLFELDKQGLSAAELSRRLKISPAALSVVLTGKERVTIDRAERIADCLGMPLSALLTEKFSKIS